VPAELAGQRPLLERAAAGDREAFARLYDVQVDGIYRYLLAWTADPAEAATLTAEVFAGAFSWLTVTQTADTEAAAWLTAMARDAVVQWRGPSASPEPPDPPGSRGPAAATLAAITRLSDPKREVVVLRLLCGHSLAHTAHLSGFTRRAVLELQLSACLSLWQLTSGTPAAPAPPASAEEFDQHLTHWDLDPSRPPSPPGTDPTLAGALAVARSLRQAAPGQVVGPDPRLVERLRQPLLTGAPLTGAPLTGAFPTEASPAGGIADRQPWWGRLSTGLLEARLLRRPWLATGAATAGIVVVLALQAFGGPAPTGACGGRPCPATTTVAVVAAAGTGSLGTPRTTVLQPSTTTSTLAAVAPPPSAPRTSAATTPPSTRPATTAPPTTAAPRPPTTTRATTTTAPTTTGAPTTTTTAPAPT